MRMKKALILCVIVLWLVGFQGYFPGPARAGSIRADMIRQAKKEGVFVIGGSNADKFRDELKGFKKRYPFLTIRAFTANAAAIGNRVFAEAQAHKFSLDLVAIGSAELEVMAKGHLLKKMEYPHLKDFPAGLQPRHGLYVQAFLNPRVQGVYNTDLVSPAEVPKSWDAMADPKWTGQTMIARSSEEFPARLAYLWRRNGQLDWKRSFAFFRRLGQQKPFLARGFRGGTKRLAAGEAAFFWFAATGPAVRLHFMGAPIGLVAFPKFVGGFRSFGILKGAAHPAAAWLFIDYISSPQGQHEFTDIISAKVPLNQKARPGKLGQWLIDQNASLANTIPIDTEILFNKAVVKKSEEFYFKLMGIK